MGIANQEQTETDRRLSSPLKRKKDRLSSEQKLVRRGRLSFKNPNRVAATAEPMLQRGFAEVEAACVGVSLMSTAEPLNLKQQAAQSEAGSHQIQHKFIHPSNPRHGRIKSRDSFTDGRGRKNREERGRDSRWN